MSVSCEISWFWKCWHLLKFLRTLEGPKENMSTGKLGPGVTTCNLWPMAPWDMGSTAELPGAKVISIHESHGSRGETGVEILEEWPAALPRKPPV